MKKLLPLLLILLMTVVGCNTAEQPTDSGFDVKDVTVTAGDQSIMALKMMDSSQTYHAGNWLCSDGFLEQRISEIYPDAPLITGKDLTLTEINADLLDICLFSADASRRKRNRTEKHTNCRYTCYDFFQNSHNIYSFVFLYYYHIIFLNRKQGFLQKNLRFRKTFTFFLTIVRQLAIFHRYPKTLQALPSQLRGHT